MPINPLNPNPNIVSDVNHIDGVFRGIVEDNDDPLNLCRLRVRVPYLNGMPGTAEGIPTDGLPWAAACIPYAGPGYGQVLIPDVGSTVWVMFENQAKDRPVWIGCSYGAQSITGKRDMKSVGYDTFVDSNGEWTYNDNREDTPYTFREHRKNSKVVIHTPKGFEISIDEADEHECLELIDRTGQLIRMYCPVTKEGNINNDAKRTSGSVMDNDTNEGILEYALDEDSRNQNYILIESQSNDNDVAPSYVRLMKNNVTVTNGKSMIDMYGNITTTDNGSVRSVYDGDEDTFVLTNYPGSVFHMSKSENAIAKGNSEVVVDDNEVLLSNGSVAIRLGSTIDLCGPVSWGYYHNGKPYGWYQSREDNYLRLYYPHIKLCTGNGASITLDDNNVVISGNTRIVSGKSGIKVDDDVMLSGDVVLTNNQSSISMQGNKVMISSDDTKIAGMGSSLVVNDKVLISGDTKIANDESSIILSDGEVDISTKEAKVANGTSSVIIHDGFVETNNCEDMVDPPDGQHPQRIGDIDMEDVSKGDVSATIFMPDSVEKGDVSVNDVSYIEWYNGQHIDMLPVQ